MKGKKVTEVIYPWAETAAYHESRATDTGERVFIRIDGRWFLAMETPSFDPTDEPDEEGR